MSNLIRDLLVKQAENFPDKSAVVFRDVFVTFSQLRDNVFRLANNLTQYGIKKGDKVALFLPNWPRRSLSIPVIAISRRLKKALCRYPL